jgi:hypothetical protein
MIILYGVTTDGTSIPIEVTDQGQLVVDTAALEGFVKEGDDVEFGTVNATGKLTGTNASFSGLLDSNGLTASPGGEGVISTRSSGGIRPVWRAGDGTFIKEDGTTYTSQITAAGDAQFKGKVLSSSTSDSDPGNTLVTKDYISSSGGENLAYGLTVSESGAVRAGAANFSVTKSGTGEYNVNVLIPGVSFNYFITSLLPITNSPGNSVRIRSKSNNSFKINGWYDPETQSDMSFELTIIVMTGNSRTTVKDLIKGKEPRK